MADEPLDVTDDLVDDAAPEGDAPEPEAVEPAGDAAPAGGKTALDATDDGKQVVPADWPADWRNKLAGDDQKLGKQLARFKSPGDLLKAYKEAERKISSGAFKEPLGDDATDEELAAYRKDHGIPDTPDGYLDKIDSGLVIGENDKELIDSFLEGAHVTNAPPEFVGMALDWWSKTQDKIQADMVASDEKITADTVDALRADWGPEYRANINAINAFLDTAPTMEDGTPLSGLLKQARLGDGSPMMSHPEALRWMMDLANERNPAGFVSPNVGGSQIDSVNDEIETIEKFMRENRSAYDKDERKQARLRQLYDAQEKLKGRAA